MAELTQYQKIMHIMARGFKGAYYLPADFMNPQLGKYFVGYEASARLSELARKYPDMIETKRKGKFLARRINWASQRLWWTDCPADLKAIINLYEGNK